MIRFENVTKVLNGKVVLDDLSFEIEKGETFVIVGPSGVGKSVTIKHMVRFFTPDNGRVFVDGENISEVDGHDLDRIRRRFGYLFQGNALLAWLTVSENVALPLREKTKMSDAEIRRKVADTLKLVSLEQDGEKLPAEISGGMGKRAGLARAIITDPEIVLYDEPTASLDPVTARTIDDMIEKMRARLGVTSVVVTHDMHSALAIGSRIAMLHRGKFVELAAPDAFIQSPCREVQAFLASQYITRDGSWERKSR
jgi:phospholipid/cholesterol/gamma-HCH transport system ATP-binding protein